MRPPNLHLVSSRQSRPVDRPEPSVRPLLGEILRRQGLATGETLEAGLAAQQKWDAKLGEVLQIDEPDLVQALRTQWQTAPLDLKKEPPDGDLLRFVNVETYLQDRLLPWRRIGAATVIAAANPETYLARKDDLEAMFGPTMLAIVSETDLKECLSQLCSTQLNTRAEQRVVESASCRTWHHQKFLALCLALLTVVTMLAIFATGILVTVLTLCGVALLIAMTGLKLMAALRLWWPARQRATAQVINLQPEAPQKLPRVSLLVPLYKEHAIAEALVKRLSALDYPEALLDICLVVEHDDDITRDALACTTLPRFFQIITVPAGSVRTKPRALNYALDFCKGSIVGVYDAEDRPDPDQITKVVEYFQDAPPNVACLQGRLAYYNSQHNIMARCFSIEYAGWFGGMLPGIAKLGLVVPLGGTTLFFRRDILEEIGAWDAHNVTEDADLGLRLARYGYQTELIDTTTWEEANCRALPWICQRSRWLKGYAMTYVTHMRQPRTLWNELSIRQFLGVQLMFGGTLAQAVLAPLLWSWWPMLFGAPHVVMNHLSQPVILSISGTMLLTEVLSWGLSWSALRRMNIRGLAGWVPVMNIYNMLATFAVYKAFCEMIICPFYWDKTSHGISEQDPPEETRLQPTL